MKREINAILIIASRDLIKLFRDRFRLLAALIFPALFVGVLGNSLQSNIGDEAGYNFIEYTFTGVLGMTLFQSTAAGIISLVEDRQNDFAQELFVSPVSRYSLILGKILGESGVALIQGSLIMVFGLIMGVSYNIEILIRMFPVAIIICMLGGAFGVVVLSQLADQRSASQIFPFVIFPQYFLSGVFSPIKELPAVLMVLSRVAPMTYAVDLMRSAFFYKSEAYDLTVIFSPLVNLGVVSALFFVFLFIGTWLFVRGERVR